MKKFIIVFFTLPLIMVILGVSILLAFKDSRPVIICTSLDDSIRPRNHCLMNPFRDKEPERLAEDLLAQMRSGNTEIIQPYVKGADKERIRENEQKYRIRTWRIGDREDTRDKVEIMYWVARENYQNESTGEDYVESAKFFFVREGNELKLETFSAIY